MTDFVEDDSPVLAAKRASGDFSHAGILLPAFKTEMKFLQVKNIVGPGEYP
ncbi:MAG: hypothetical protein Q8P35_03025 [Candidatus Yanofskybacteria bacterium]|nr:hypothetical protein [Candidatus Yanofskybacteria bacterium]